jgi:hypothetical protein
VAEQLDLLHLQALVAERLLLALDLLHLPVAHPVIAAVVDAHIVGAQRHRPGRLLQLGDRVVLEHQQLGDRQHPVPAVQVLDLGPRRHSCTVYCRVLTFSVPGSGRYAVSPSRADVR